MGLKEKRQQRLNEQKVQSPVPRNMNSSIPLEKVNSETIQEERKRYVVHNKSGSSNVLPTYREDEFTRKNTPER